MSQTISFIHPSSLAFPPLESALTEPNGLLAVGGDLTPQRLVQAYSEGIFPWFSDGEPIMWWSPDPRAIIPTSDIRINRSLRKFLNKTPYQVSINRAFDQVIELCADAPFRHDETWIVPEMMSAYRQLHLLGHAHSVEVWDQEKLVGGLYGVAINGFFSGESMFYKAPNASKIALVTLAKQLEAQGITFIDCQITNPFLEDMGCVEVSRSKFIKQKQAMQSVSLTCGFWTPRIVSY
ncbi:leucyl/phenylalanyl-tRNA--protein transferase [Thalassotalea euphylliae]|uniref:Leucyl/phenylalanyl-tRNA--protein transferase n=1 Tax=Thalassotalea euphylliae TaxID=1655234 RepID=A0A3E0TQF6_9GAMM|nr:leucyl/phenylalanyl-tRNA--protein transferase [Thalassotalea euphylliae]REL26826.1 leucyl/phenylalanyl-tRNA--protein transferase [Thalassotalea euphylliae]